VRRDDLLDLNDVLQHPGRRLAVDISTELAEEEELDLVSPLEGFLEAVSTGSLLVLTGEFSTRVVLECARCTGPIEEDIKFELDEQFQVEGTPSSLNPQEVAKVVSDEPYPLFDGNELMVEQLLRQALWINMPVQPLCSFGWEGDCPSAAERGIANAPVADGRPEFDKLKNLMSGDSTDL
jgi:uncharacterized metal-binding protein YceD (DUF177 family)